MKNFERHVKKTAAVLFTACLALLAAGLLFRPAALIGTAEAAETENVPELPEAPIRLERTLTYGYSAEEARIPVELTNTGEEMMAITIEKCELTDTKSGFSLDLPPAAETQFIIEPGGSETICTVQFEKGMPYRMAPYTAMLAIGYTDIAPPAQENR